MFFKPVHAPAPLLRNQAGKSQWHITPYTITVVMA